MSTKTTDCRNLPVSTRLPLLAWQTRRAALPAWQTGTVMVPLVTERFEGTEHPARDLPVAV